MLTATKARIFVNVSSGFRHEERTEELLRDMLGRAGWDVDIVQVRKGTDISQLALRAVEEGSRVICAGGGDGTLRAVASAVAGTDVSFGVLPVGTLNHFARDLQIPLDLEGAARVLANGRVKRVDVGQVNGWIFLNNAIIGLYPVYRFLKAEQERRGRHRWLAFVRAVAAVFRRYPFMTVRFSLDGRDVVRKTPYILVANNRHAMQGYQLGSRRSLEEGKLWVYVMRRQGRWGLVKLVLNLLFGRFSADRDFDVFDACEVWVETRRKRIGVALDGEVRVMEAPLRFQSLPRSLNVMTPRE